MFTCEVLQFIVILHKDIYITAGAKMVVRGYQNIDCDHSEVIQNIFEIVFALFYEH